jgi:DNA (cytosine-5)-methyltransferase 1
LGWSAAFFAEIDPFCCALLAERYPNVPNLGDINAPNFIEKARACGPITVLVGGPPCQAFSIAGLRGGLADARGNLTLRYLAVVDALRPRWMVYENVPGILSATSHVAPDQRPPFDNVEDYAGLEDGTEIVVEDRYDSDEDHAFSCFLAGLSEIGYGWSYGSMDAEYFGLAQRRERVFVVGYPGAWQPAAAVLLDECCLRWDSPPSRETGQATSGASGAGLAGGSEWGARTQSVPDGERPKN